MLFSAGKNAGTLYVSAHDKSALGAGKNKPPSIGFRWQFNRITQLFESVPIELVH